MKNIKKFICLLIMTVLITPSIAIAEDTYSGYFNNEEITMFADTSVKISENEKSAVEDIISDLNNLKTESDIQKYNIPLDNIQELIDSLPKAIQYEHPELFYVDLQGKNFSYKSEDGQTISSIIVKEPFTMEKDEISKAQKLIDDECDKISASVPKDATDVEKVLFVHDYITSHYEYDTTYQNRTLYTAVRDKKCVCQGYSYLFMYVMNKYFDIECTTVPSDTCQHMWNKVKIDDKWYNIDLTSDDPLPNLSSLANHTYFLLSDEELKTVSAASATDQGVYNEALDIHRTWNVNTWYGEPVITAEDDTYKDSIIHNVSRSVSFLDGKIYCFNDKNELSALDLSTNTFTPAYKDTSKYYWFVYGDNKSAYSSHFNVTVAYSGKLYFNSPNKVFEFDAKTNTAKEIYEYTEIPDISKTYLFGLTVKDGNLCAEYTTNLMNGVESFITIITAPKPTETPIVTESPTVTESPVPTETPTVTEVPKPVIAYESKITPKDDGTYTISVDKKIETTDTPILYVAEFDENNILIGLKAVPYTEPVSVSAHDDSQMLKAFVWNIGEGGADIFLDYFMLIIQGYVCTLPGSYNREIFLFGKAVPKRYGLPESNKISS